jgi:hypothetical protein
MSTPAPLTDLHWLVSAAAEPWLARAAELAVDPLAAVSTLRRDLSAERTHLVLQQVDLRHRAKNKFTAANRMFFTPVGLQQATDEIVAQYKALRFVAVDRVADLCCGIGGDLLALAVDHPAVGVDRDPAVCVIAEANAAAYDCPGATVVSADVTEFPLDEYVAWHLDPDRRPAGRRTTRVELHEPSVDAMNTMLDHGGDAAIKLAPAAVLPDTWEQTAELQWISRRRECRQLVGWFGRLAQHPGKRTASVLTTSIGEAPATEVRTVIGEADVEIPVAPIGRYLFEPDAAVLAAHLSGALAAEHDLAAVSTSFGYLTGDHPITDDALVGFEVWEVLPYHVGRVKELLRQRNIGRLEVKKRDVPLDPDQVRRQVRVPGDQSATLLLTQVQGKTTAILAERIMASNRQPDPSRKK